MVGIVDAGRIIRPVKIGEEDIVCTGVSLEGLVLLLDRFPEFKRLITPARGGEVDTSELTVEGLLKLGPRIIGAVIAAGIGEPGVADAENAAKMLPIGYQVRLIKNIMDLTFPGGTNSFVEDLRAIGLVGADSPTTNTGESAGTGKALATNSLSPPQNSTTSDIGMS